MPRSVPKRRSVLPALPIPHDRQTSRGDQSRGGESLKLRQVWSQPRRLQLRAQFLRAGKSPEQRRYRHGRYAGNAEAWAAVPAREACAPRPLDPPAHIWLRTRLRLHWTTSGTEPQLLGRARDRSRGGPEPESGPRRSSLYSMQVTFPKWGRKGMGRTSLFGTSFETEPRCPVFEQLPRTRQAAD